MDEKEAESPSVAWHSKILITEFSEENILGCIVLLLAYVSNSYDRPVSLAGEMERKQMYMYFN